MSGEAVLVTGGSGFVGAHCLVQVLAAGYQARTTVRSLDREAAVRALLKRGGAEPGEALAFFPAELTRDGGWAEAADGCDFVLHVASPFPPQMPEDADELIVPARQGALRVLRAAREAGVKRVVLTSSFAAIGYGEKPREHPFSEHDWTDPAGPGLSAYVRSKTLAERAAWDFVAREGGGLELSVVNPVGVFGPALGPDLSSSVLLVQRLLSGALPGLPRLAFGVVDVRDVADLHLRAMTHPAAAGERFLAVAGPCMTLQEVAALLKARLGEAAANVPTRALPDWLFKLAARFDASVAQLVPELGKVRAATNAKARTVLDWAPRSNEEALLATARSLVELGLVAR